MKPEEYPSKTLCKYTNIVTGVLKYFERMIKDDLRGENFCEAANHDRIPYLGECELFERDVNTVITYRTAERQSSAV